MPTQKRWASRSERDCTPTLNAAADTLITAGYSAVELTRRVTAGIPTLVAWAADEQANALVPHIVVAEWPQRLNQRTRNALQRGARHLGATHLFLLKENAWHDITAATTAQQTHSQHYSADVIAQQFAAPTTSAGVSITDAELAAGVLGDIASDTRNNHRLNPSGNDLISDIAQRIRSIATTGASCLRGTLTFERHTLMHAAVEVFGRMQDVSDFTSDPIVSTAMVQLLGTHARGVIGDPFTGLGGHFLAIAAADRNNQVTAFEGNELNEELAATAQSWDGLTHIPTTITRGDSFSANLMERFDAVISTPPVDLTVDEYTTATGEITTDGNLAGIDKLVHSLKPGGRAVLHLPISVLKQPEYESYRRYLNEHFRIGALIAIPACTYYSVLLVIDRAQPTGETFVASLDTGWRRHLRPGSDFLHTALQHLDGDTPWQ